MTRTFEITKTGPVAPHHMAQEYPHIIWPLEVGVDNPPIRTEVARFETVTKPTYGIMLIRQFLLPEDDGTELVLTQHLSERVGATMGLTALLLPNDDNLVRGEQTICNNALERMFRVWAKDAGRG